MREREGEWHAAKGPRWGFEPGATAAKTKLLHMHHHDVYSTSQSDPIRTDPIRTEGVAIHNFPRSTLLSKMVTYGSIKPRWWWLWCQNWGLKTAVHKPVGDVTVGWHSDALSIATMRRIWRRYEQFRLKLLIFFFYHIFTYTTSRLINIVDQYIKCFLC